MSNHSEEKTFRSYSKKDAAQYAEARWQYSDALYQTVISHHTSTGGKLDTVVDIGCGPGLATFRLVPYFSTVIGLDPSEGMISEARSALDAFEQPGTTSIRFETSTAEDISSTLIPDGSVDLITAATCAHVSRLYLVHNMCLSKGIIYVSYDTTHFSSQPLFDSPVIIKSLTILPIVV